MEWFQPTTKVTTSQKAPSKTHPSSKTDGASSQSQAKDLGKSTTLPKLSESKFSAKPQLVAQQSLQKVPELVNYLQLICRCIFHIPNLQLLNCSFSQ